MGQVYEAGQLTSDELQAEIDRIFADPAAWELVRGRAGENVPFSAGDVPLKVEPGAAGLDPATATVIVAAITAFGPTINKIITDLWNEVWLPMIKARKGDNAVGPPK